MRPPATLYVYMFYERPVFMRLKIVPGPLPACSRLFDAVWEIPVVAQGPRPLGVRARKRCCVADWLLDLVKEGDRERES